MGTNEDRALSWANGFCHGVEYLALAYQARIDGGQTPANALFAGQIECLLFIEQVIVSGPDRGKVVDLFRYSPCRGVL
jgi:hypothetical protein